MGKSEISFLIVWCSIVIVILGSFGYYLFISSKEKKAFKEMLANPNNNTVKKYIKVFKKSNNILMTICQTGARYGLKREGDKTRQAQGFDIIYSNSNVSDKVKQDLYFAFISEGIVAKK